MPSVDAVLDSMRELSDATIKKVVDDTIEQFYDSIVELTPVDTGTAKASWVMYDRGGYTIINNNLPYMTHLEWGLYGNGPKTINGYSTQAPTGMVRVSTLKFQTFVNKAARKHKI